jgi:phosphatidylcholine synthase
VDISRTGARLAATLVHAYTAVGAVLALLMVHFSYKGNLQAVLGLFLVALIVDGTDGFLARHFRVKEVMPGFDGELLDNILDYITYAFAPMVFLLANGFLPSGFLGWVCAVCPLLASCVQFCRSDAKTDDHFFLGFPDYWNIVAFYVVVMNLSTSTTTIILGVCTVLVFVPIKYLYPSRTVPLHSLSMTLSTLWLALFGLIVLLFPDEPTWLVWVSLTYPVYYVAISLWLTASMRPGGKFSVVQSVGTV